MTAKQNKTDTIRQSESHHIKAGQGDPLGGKESQDNTKESDTHPVPPSGVPQKTLIAILSEGQVENLKTP